MVPPYSGQGALVLARQRGCTHHGGAPLEPGTPTVHIERDTFTYRTDAKAKDFSAPSLKRGGRINPRRY
jgi:hypothetical protein